MFNKEEILSETLLKNVFDIRIETDNAFIFTISDAHLGMGNLCYIKDMINFIKKTPNSYVVLGGDIFENAIRLSRGDIRECYAPPQKQLEMAVELFTPIKDKILALIEGNHEKRTEDAAYISLTQMLATMLGIPTKYKYELAIGYISVGNDNCYTYVDLHKHKKTKNYYDFYNANILILEHTHELSYTEKPVIFHNKYTKKPSIRINYVINNGTALAFASYAKKEGYAIQNLGSYVVELSGKKRNIKVWRDSDLYDAIERGYK